MKNLSGSTAPWTLAISRVPESGHDLAGRRYFRGTIFGEERDDYGRRKTIITGEAVEGDWALLAAAPELLKYLKEITVAIRLDDDRNVQVNPGLLGLAMAGAIGAIRKAEGKK